jgi:hypothetical protein
MQVNSDKSIENGQKMLDRHGGNWFKVLKEAPRPAPPEDRHRDASASDGK